MPAVLGGGHAHLAEKQREVSEHPEAETGGSTMACSSQRLEQRLAFGLGSVSFGLQESTACMSC